MDPFEGPQSLDIISVRISIRSIMSILKLAEISIVTAKEPRLRGRRLPIGAK